MIVLLPRHFYGNRSIPDAPTKPLTFISKLKELYKSSKERKKKDANPLRLSIVLSHHMHRN